MKREEKAIFDVFGDGFDRFAFPANICRVTAGHGGEALLIAGSEKSALLDCGMAYCGRKMVDNLREALDNYGMKTLDYVLLSHSHYDHIGALPYIRQAFPDAAVCGSRKCCDILARTGARKLMKELGTAARDLYAPDSTEEIPVDDLNVDIVLNDGDEIYLGNEKIKVLETRGHTDCSLSFALEPARLLFTSESTGILEAIDYVHTPILKSCRDALESLQKCMDYNAEYICIAHFGMLPQYFNDIYWRKFREEYESKYDFIGRMDSDGLSEEEMLKKYVDRYWTPAKEKEQPREAYEINSAAIIKAFLREIRSSQII
ncbi:MAG: MBL fold metallo-hydrolase [Bacillota bacterium]|nr:MBL fold metallo-hydrolase [Bacillota bacterium]